MHGTPRNEAVVLISGESSPMLSKLEVVLYAASLPIAPIAIYSLWTGSKAPENSSLSKYYAAEKYLGATGNLMLLSLCVGNLLKLGQHFGIINLQNKEGLALAFGLPFFILCLLYLGLWVSALRKVRRAARADNRT